MTASVFVDAILFDMDGTLVDSTIGVVYAWHCFAQTYPGLDVGEILNTAHGIRTIENLRNYCGIDDEEILEEEAARFEREIINGSKQNGGERGISSLPGARDLVAQISKDETPENPGWAICTSATAHYAKAALKITNIAFPPVFVAADNVSQGKPSPEPYLLAAEGCGVDPTKCLVIEDAPAGIMSGQAAGCKVLAVLTSHNREAIEATKPDFIVPDLTWVTIDRKGSSITVNIRQK